MKKHLFKLIVTLLCVATLFEANGQNTHRDEGAGDNLVKFNTLTLPVGKFSVEYERAIASRITVGAAVSFRPESGLPFRSTIKGLIDDDDFDRRIDDIRSSNFSITPEVRFYTSNRGQFRGLYIAPYVKYATYGLSMPFDFELTVDHDGQPVYGRTETIPLSGNIRSFVAGVSVGVNFKLSNSFYLDWRIIGPGYGWSKGDVSGTMALDAYEQLALRQSLGTFKSDLENLPLPLKIDYDVHGEGATIELLNSPWANIRSGLSVSYRF